MKATADEPYGCQDASADWGEVCPSCGQRLPDRQGPLSSWMSLRPGQWPSAKGDTRWSPEARARRQATFARLRDQRTERQLEVVRIVEKHGGNRSAAARELGVTASSVITTLARIRALGFPVPPPERQAS